MSRKKYANYLLIAVILLVIIVNPVGAADPSLDVSKTVTTTGPDTATINITLTGSGEAQTTPIDLVFAIDSSGSMMDSDPTDLRKTASKNFVDKLDPTSDQAGVVNWDDVIEQRQDLTNNFAAVKTVIDQGAAIGGTNMGLGLSTAVNILDLGGKIGANHVIIFLSDGVNGGGTDPVAEATTAAGKGYIIYTVGLGSYVDQTLMENIATATGGKYYFAADANALDPIFNDIFNEIKTAATSIHVTDVLPTYIQLLDDPNFSIEPDSIVLNQDGTTTLTWLIDKMNVDDVVTMSFDVRSIKSGNILTNVYPDPKVTYLNFQGDPVTVVLPEVRADFVTEDGQDSEDGVPMQDTGVPAVLLVLGLAAALGGALYPRIK